MAIFYQNNAGFKIAPITSGTIGTYVDLTDHVMALTLNRSLDELDVTAMGNLGHSFIAGLDASSLSVDLLNDDAASNVMATLNTLYGTLSAFKIIQNSSVAISATNPVLTGTILVNKITPIAGKVGDVAVQSLTFTVSGTITVTNTGTW
ncbi:MAG: radical SAM protein [Actinomycetes bacterium]